MFRETLVSTPSVRLNIARGPAAGPPLFMLHGVVRQWTDFAPVFPFLTSRWEVSAWDARGHGKSDRHPSGYHVVDYITDAAAVLRNSLQTPCVLWGHSLGAMVAAGAAAAAPDMVRAIILEDPPFDTMGPELANSPLHSVFAGYRDVLQPNLGTAELAERLAEMPIRGADGRTLRFGDVRDACALRYLASCLAQMDPAVLNPIVASDWLTGFDWRRQIGQIRCPTLLLQSDVAAGGMLTDADADHFRGTAVDCTVIRFPGVGHGIHATAVPELMRYVTPFLESLR